MKYFSVRNKYRYKNKSPKVYFESLIKQCTWKEELIYGGIDIWDELYRNLDDNDILRKTIEMEVDYYQGFLDMRRKLMANRIKRYYNSLKI